jgi:pyruvate/2-oxoglutarate dehydrogenase complex dihydrolipoamide dehydrogenase (E3) component
MTDGRAHYDLVVVGGGQAGPPLAHAAARAGRRVALAERRRLGGSCVNFGCTPTKAVLASARIAHLARRGRDYGVRIPSVDVDFAGVLARAKRIVAQSVAHLDRQFAEAGGNPRLIRGHARLAGREGDRFRIDVGGDRIDAAQVVLDTGTRSRVPPIDGIDDIRFIDADHWLDHDELPRHLLMVGGGYVGLEMSQFYRRMGTRITVVHPGAHLVEREDDDVADALQGILEAEGITFLLGHRATRFAKTASGVRTTLAANGREQDIETSHVFLAVGRKPNTDDLGLHTVGIEVSDSGIVEVDDRLATSTPGIFAAGDIRGGPMFTHTAWDDYRILASQLLADGARTTGRIVPYAVFTDPSLGRVGLTERQARDANGNVRVGRFEMRDNGKAREIGETAGFSKVVVDADSRQILGAAVLAVEGAELVHLYVDLMNAHAGYDVLRDAIHVHPTLAEAMQSAVSRL